MLNVLIGSSIQQKKEILDEFLISLKELIVDGMNISYIFIDDNIKKDSQKTLINFKNNHENVVITYSEDEISKYKCNDYTHHWREDNIKKVTNNKNRIISYFLDGVYDYLFLIDSDIVLHPKTLQRLLGRNREIISNIFWTKWSPDEDLMPQVWLYDNYSYYKKYGIKKLTNIEAHEKKIEFINKLKVPGTYPVGGLGACTLISRSALEKGINFSPIYNISYWGEDRHFCIRAAVLGVELYVDTYYPAYHIYREEYLEGIKSYKYLNNFRDYEIYRLQLSELAKVSVEAYETIDENDTKWPLFFNTTLHSELNELRETEKNEDGTAINRICKVYDTNMMLDETSSKFSGNIYFMEYGYKNEESFYEEWQAKITIEKECLGVWRITEYRKIQELMVESKPITRTVRNSNTITLSMIVKNEENRYLKNMLESAREFIQEAVIIDDGSTDNTIQIIKDTLKGIKLRIIENKESTFKNESSLRKQQWNETIKTNPDWILFLDADEIFEECFKTEVFNLIKDKSVDVYSFRLYDMWCDNRYREDIYWSAHKSFRPFLIRYQKNFQYKFNEKKQHCGRMPENVIEQPQKISYLRLKHYGWAREEDRIGKYKRYKKLDPNSEYGIKQQYESILDENPNLKMWIE